MKEYRKLGEYIQQVDVRNTDLSVTHLLGVSVEKRFGKFNISAVLKHLKFI